MMKIGDVEVRALNAVINLDYDDGQLYIEAENAFRIDLEVI